MNRKKLFLWCLYDFANSIIWGNFLLYFTRWIVIDAGLSDLNFNLIFVACAIIMLFIAPRIAARVDRNGGLVRHLAVSTIGMTLFLGAAALFPIFSWPATIAAFMFLAGLTFYQMSFVFFTPLINDIADEKHRARASGWTQFANAIGMIFGLIVFMPFANTGIGALLPATIAFFLLSLPIMLLYKEDRKIMRSAEDAIEKIDFSKLKRLFAVPGVAAALLSFFFFNDALVSIMNNLSIYTKQVFGATEAQTILLVVGVSVFSAIGALIGGRLGDRVGPRSMIIAGLAAWTLLLVAFALAPTFIMACFITAALGLFLGALWTNSRAYMASVLPKKDLAYGFSFYVIFERFSSIWGPLTWGLIIAFSGSYRLAVGVLAISTLLGIMAMFYRINPNKKIATMK